MQTECLLEVQAEMFQHVAGGTLTVLRCLLLPQNTENEVKVQVSGERNCDGDSVLRHSDPLQTAQRCAAIDRCTLCTTL